ncbi:hypothetical protein [Caminibacter mediatlanticus]|uniref:Uncharacterized protein n=1 Tax=Caminibacter mediatlanticus TB-2 TaxID=391592 RepID=A0AAI9AG62_9BACT|nr:hypothetical protein [Caminibacter mediatlanticus]EDM22905.1 hypothetical protein CMTB2_05437 [Caminibacter mediatlanticus TB-2]
MKKILLISYQDEKIKPIIHSIIPYFLLFGLSNFNLWLGITTALLYWAVVFFVYFEIKKKEPFIIIISFLFFSMLISGI